MALRPGGSYVGGALITSPGSKGRRKTGSCDHHGDLLVCADSLMPLDLDLDLDLEQAGGLFSTSLVGFSGSIGS